jgi:predicted secreted protein
MAVKRGTDGLIEVATDSSGTPGTYVLVASQQTWTIDASNETIDTTVLGAQRFRTNLTTFIAWSGSFDGFWDDDDLAAAEGQGILTAALLSGGNVWIRITPSATDSASGAPTSGDIVWFGKCRVASNSPSGGFDSAVQISVAFEGDGALVSAPLA